MTDDTLTRSSTSYYVKRMEEAKRAMGLPVEATEITRTSCGYPEICHLARLLDMAPTDPTKVIRSAIAALTGSRETTLAQAREIMLKALSKYEEHA